MKDQVGAALIIEKGIASVRHWGGNELDLSKQQQESLQLKWNQQDLM